MIVIDFNDNWFMFERTKPLSQANIDRVRDKANIKRITNHVSKYSHTSNSIANGINIVIVSKRLGHSNINMTLKIYTHLIKKFR